MSESGHFVVIGAQKCGTTTLYEDLKSHPDVSVGAKESSGLLKNDVTTEAGRRAYWSAFPPRRPGRATGEVSTEYTMLPTIDAAARAALVFEAVKVIYIVRDPVARTISNHHHAFAAQHAPADIDVAVRTVPELVENSRYATQLAPWLDAFGPDNVLVLKFESYMADRRRGFKEVQAFLGLDAHALSDPEAAHNEASDRWVATGGWRRIRSSAVYLRLVRRAIPGSLRRRLVRSILPAPPPRPPGPGPETLETLVRQLQPEVDRLAEMLKGEPLWDLAEIYLSDPAR